MTVKSFLLHLIACVVLYPMTVAGETKSLTSPGCKANTTYWETTNRCVGIEKDRYDFGNSPKACTDNGGILATLPNNETLDLAKEYVDIWKDQVDKVDKKQSKDNKPAIWFWTGLRDVMLYQRYALWYDERYETFWPWANLTEDAPDHLKLMFEDDADHLEWARGDKVDTEYVWCQYEYDPCYTRDGGCAKKCHRHEGGDFCKCDKGYGFNKDYGGGCDDINECHDAALCEQLCYNNAGSYFCGCYEGYKADVRGVCNQQERAEQDASNYEIPLIVGLCLLALFVAAAVFVWRRRSRSPDVEWTPETEDFPDTEMETNMMENDGSKPGDVTMRDDGSIETTV